MTVPLVKYRDPKTNRWDTVAVIKGDSGPQGVKGEKGEKGEKGDRGNYWRPIQDGSVISWIDSTSSVVPPPIDITGPQGPKGDKGETGAQGPQGNFWRPAYNNSTGDLSWSNSSSTTAPPIMNIRGPQGPQGIKGDKGEPGAEISVSVNNITHAPQNGIVTLPNMITTSGGKITSTTASTSKETGALIVAGGVGVSKNIYAEKVYGAVWNDYAETRKCIEVFSPGTVVVEDKKNTDFVIKSTKRLSKGAMIVSDTYGFCIGEEPTEEYEVVPIALNGRVLAATNEQLKVNDTVCCGENGTVSKMKWWEKILFPDCILGIVSSIPNYQYWSGIEIKNRIWIKIK